MDRVDSMSDAELRAYLLRHGYNVAITASNRNFLKNKLRQLLANNTNRPLRYTVVNNEPIQRQNFDTIGRYTLLLSYILHLRCKEVTNRQNC